MRKRSVLNGFTTITAACLFVACGDDPSPVKPSPLSTSPFAGIEVVGPDSLGAGQSAQFVANIRLVDGTTKSATGMPNLRWRSSNLSVMSVSNSGLVTAANLSGLSGLDEALITAEIAPEGAVQGTRKVVLTQVTNGLYTLSVSAQSVTAGSPLTVTWAVPGGGSPSDWIAIYKVGSSHFAYGDIWWSYTQGSSAGTFTIPAPGQPGLYEFRYFVDDGFEMTAKSSVIEVTPAIIAGRRPTP